MKTKNPHHQANTFFMGELQVFTSKPMEPTEEMLNRPRKRRPKTSVPIPPRIKKNIRKKKT